MTLVQVRLSRDSFQTAWGFRLQGGKDLNQELTVQRVEKDPLYPDAIEARLYVQLDVSEAPASWQTTLWVFSNTPSEGELQRGDVIVAINGRDTSGYSHKQALEAISGGGGQIELVVQRVPAHLVNIKPLTPTIETRAPTFPFSPTKAPQIVIPIQRRQSGSHSSSRIIPILLPKSSSPTKPAASREQPSEMSTSVGFMPKKVTLNKFGGGGRDFGSAYGPAAAHTPQSPQRSQPHSRGYQLASTQLAISQDHYDSAQNQPQINYQTQFSAPQHISPQQQAIQRARKPIPKLDRKTAGEKYTNYGVDYSKTLPKAQSSKHAATFKQRSPPVSRYDDELDAGMPWSNTLRSEGRQLKPWEREAMELERYQSSTVEDPYRPHSQPPVAANKQKIIKITAKSTASPPDQQMSTSVSMLERQKKPLLPGQRDWSDSHVYKMIHSSEQTTSVSSRQNGSCQTPKGESIKGTREVHETKYTGQEPQRSVTETVTRAGIPDYTFDSSIGISDF